MRIFLYLTFVVILACAVPLAAVQAQTQAQTPAEQRAGEETHIPGLRFAATPPALAQQGVQIVYVTHTVSPGGSRYSCGGLDALRLKDAARLATSALEKIPAAAWPRIPLKYLLLCRSATDGGREIGGIPVPPLQLLMLSTGDSPGATSRFAYTVLHELYHLIEMQQGGLHDAAWDAAFTGYDNSYGPTAGATAPGSGGKGFINGYGRSFAHEERAEIFAYHMMAAPQLEAFITQQQDTTLRQKRDMVRDKAALLLGL